MTNVKCQTATVTVTASVENVNAYVVTKENSVKKVNSLFFLHFILFLYFLPAVFFIQISSSFTYHFFSNVNIWFENIQNIQTADISVKLYLLAASYDMLSKNKQILFIDSALYGLVRPSWKLEIKNKFPLPHLTRKFIASLSTPSMHVTYIW